MVRPIGIIVLIIFLILSAYPLFASSSSIESLSKILTAKGYTFKINYQTDEEWTDGLIFKLFCSFNKGAEFSFTSAGYNNIEKGWHKTEIFVPKVYRDRYGYITDYRLELYQKGILLSIKSM